MERFSKWRSILARIPSIDRFVNYWGDDKHRNLFPSDLKVVNFYLITVGKLLDIIIEQTIFVNEKLYRSLHARDIYDVYKVDCLY